MCCLQNIAMRDYQERATTGQTHGQTDAGQSDPYVPLCFAIIMFYFILSNYEIIYLLVQLHVSGKLKKCLQHGLHPPPLLEIDALALLYWYVTVYPMVYITSYSRLESSCPWPSTTGPGTAFHSFIEIYCIHVYVIKTAWFDWQFMSPGVDLLVYEGYSKNT